MKVLFIAGFGPITSTVSESRRLYEGTLGIRFKVEDGEYLHTEEVKGANTFAVWPLDQAAESCFGTSDWPADTAVPHAWLEFDVDDIEAATKELEEHGYRLLVRREGSRVRCFTRGGYDWADRFPAIVEAASRLRAQSFLIDGEVIVCRPDGLSDFDALRYRRGGYSATLVAFDLIQLQDDDLRDQPLVKR